MLDYGFYNMDCIDGMREFPDQFFDLAIVDPPYGIGVFSMNYTKSGAIRTRGKSAAKRRDYRKQSQWDIKPEQEYFDEGFEIDAEYYTKAKARLEAAEAQMNIYDFLGG